MTDFPALPPDTVCKRCTALQALGVALNHPNYIQTQASAVTFLPGFRDTHAVSAQGWRQCLHCGISAPHLATAPNVSKTVCLNQVCLAWAASIDGEFVQLVGVMDIFSRILVSSLAVLISGGEIMAPPPVTSSMLEQRVHATQTRLKRFFPPTTTLTAATLKPRSSSGSSLAEKLITVAYNVSCSSSRSSHKSLAKVLLNRSVVVIPKLLTRELVDRQLQNQDQC